MRRFLILAVAVLTCFASPLFAEESVRPGFTPLFNGKDLTGWHGMAHLRSPQAGRHER